MSKVSKSHKKKTPQKRKRAVPVYKTLRFRLATAIIGITAMAGSLWHLDRTGWIAETTETIKTGMIDATANVGFRVEDVLVVGRDRTDEADILRALSVERGSALFGFSPASARLRIQELPWVMEASVERLYPNTILVQVSERQPLALWQKDGTFRLIDQNGDVILTEGLEPYAGLLIVVGDGAPSHAAELIAMMRAEPHLASLVKAAVRIGDRRWNLRLANNVDVRLPELEPRAAWSRLAAYQKQHRVLDRDVRVLDLRFPDRLIVETERSKNPETLQRVSDQKT